nr:hypothetical protein BaRGS_031449 [Batillaria attramentaria]
MFCACTYKYRCVPRLELSRVEQFRRQQQKMEEENKQRRQLLADAIKQRKRYERAEKEFVEAKLALAEKSDVKESLTGTSVHIIQQNEARKAASAWPV